MNFSLNFQLVWVERDLIFHKQVEMIFKIVCIKGRIYIRLLVQFELIPDNIKILAFELRIDEICDFHCQFIDIITRYLSKFSLSVFQYVKHNT